MHYLGASKTLLIDNLRGCVPHLALPFQLASCVSGMSILFHVEWPQLNLVYVCMKVNLTTQYAFIWFLQIPLASVTPSSSSALPSHCLLHLNLPLHIPLCLSHKISLPATVVPFYFLGFLGYSKLNVQLEESMVRTLNFI